MFETIWIFIKMMFTWVILPVLGIIVLIKLFFLLFNRIGNKAYDRNMDRKKTRQMDAIISRGKTEDEKKTIRYFIKHDEAEYSDHDYRTELKALWKEGLEDIEVPEEDGKRISMYFDESYNMTDPDSGALLRRCPDGEMIPSVKQRLSIFLGTEKLYIRTYTVDMIKKSCSTDIAEYAYSDIQDMSSQRLHPLHLINGNEARVLSSTLSILARGGKRRTWKGIDYDMEPLLGDLKQEVEWNRRR